MTANAAGSVGRLAALATACGLLVGCGSTSSASSGPTPPTKARATAYAHAVNLQPGDLPGMTVMESEREIAPGAPTRVQSCAGVSMLAKSVLKVDSARFAAVRGRQHEQITSNVEVMPTTALAAKKNAAEESARGISCAESLLLPKTTARAGGRVHFGHATVTRLPDPLPGVKGVVGIRLAVPILGVPTAIEPGQPISYIDAFAFLSGPAEVSLATTAFPNPPSGETETRLLELLHRRATAEPL